MKRLEQFAEEASLFESWAKSGIRQGEEGVWSALQRLSALYLKALELGPPRYGDNSSERSFEHVSDSEWHEIASNVSKLSVDLYSVVFDPLVLPPQEPLVGSLADDIADIYRNVVYGLRAYRCGQFQQAHWEWTFNFEVHWGRHATRAIAALHQCFMNLAAEKFRSDK